MSIKYLTFEECQAHYLTFFPPVVHDAFHSIQNGIHRIAIIVEDAMQTPELILKVIQLGILIFSLFPKMNPYLDSPKQFYSDARTYAQFFKGIKSIDGLLNLQFAWKSIVMTTSGMTLFILSSISLGERFRFFEATAIKVALAAIPVLGVLPYGGLLTIAINSLMSMLLIFSLEKKTQLEEEENAIQMEKLPFWSQLLDLSKIQTKLTKYAEKIKELKDEISSYEQLLQDGKQIELELNQTPDAKIREIEACLKASEEIQLLIESKQEEYEHIEQKRDQWSLLEKNWSIIDTKEIEKFCLAKEEKWETKLHQVHLEQYVNQFSIVTSTVMISKGILSVGSTVTSYNILPTSLGNGMEFFSTGGGVINFFMKRYIRKLQQPASIDLGTYVKLGI